jgi:hypothetical protein
MHFMSFVASTGGMVLGGTGDNSSISSFTFWSRVSLQKYMELTGPYNKSGILNLSENYKVKVSARLRLSFHSQNVLSCCLIAV